MNKLQYHLLKLAEECSEVAKAASKSSMFGFSSTDPTSDSFETNEEQLEKELIDLFATVQILQQKYGFNFNPTQERVQVKKEKIGHYLEACIKLGTVRNE